jgi:hypothetical protein
MSELLAKTAAAVAVASAVSFLSLGVASAQDADAIRGKCISEAMKAYSDPDLVAHQTARVNLYINCMRNNGLTP